MTLQQRATKAHSDQTPLAAVRLLPANDGTRLQSAPGVQSAPLFLPLPRPCAFRSHSTVHADRRIHEPACRAATPLQPLQREYSTIRLPDGALPELQSAQLLLVC